VFLVRVWQVLNVGVSAYCLTWAVAVWKSRRRTNDQLGGHILALSWAGFLMSTIVGTGWRIHVHAGLTPAMPFVSTALMLGIYAQVYAANRRDDE
jgi:hypothetical protein